jgi:hypothetical protein
MEDFFSALPFRSSFFLKKSVKALMFTKYCLFLQRLSITTMWKYGRKVIESLLKRRTERPAIRAEFASRSEADSDRSDIRVFEAGLSAEQYGDYQQSTGNA